MRTPFTWFEPAPQLEAARERLGLLGRIGAEACMLEFFHEAPSVEDVRECVRKQHQLAAWRTRTARTKGQAKPPMPRLWILAAGTPEQVLEDYAFQRMDDWPAGCWEAAKALALHVVALRELPEVRATLTLRLFGAGPTFVRAVRELAALPEDAWEREAIVPYLLAFRMDLRSRNAEDGLDEDAMAYVNELETIYSDWEAKTLAAGRKEGRKEGQQELLIKQFQLKFGTLADEIVQRVHAASDAELERWAERVLVANDIDEVFAEP